MTESGAIKPNDQTNFTNDVPSWKAIATVIGVAGISTVTGFCYAYSSCRNNDSSNLPEVANNAIYNSKTISRNISDSGFRLAARAFGWATILTSFSVGGFCLLMCSVSGAKNMSEFNGRMRSLFPTSWRISSPSEDINIKTFSEFYDYISIKNKGQIEK